MAASVVSTASAAWHRELNTFTRFSADLMSSVLQHSGGKCRQPGFVVMLGTRQAAIRKSMTAWLSRCVHPRLARWCILKPPVDERPGGSLPHLASRPLFLKSTKKSWLLSRLVISSQPKSVSTSQGAYWARSSSTLQERCSCSRLQVSLSPPKFPARSSKCTLVTTHAVNPQLAPQGVMGHVHDLTTDINCQFSKQAVRGA